MISKRGELTLIVLSVVLVLFLGGLSLQFFKSDDSVSGLAVNEINVLNSKAFSYGHVCTRNSDCRSNICSNRKCVDCLSDRNCREGYYCNNSKKCVESKDVYSSCSRGRECNSGFCFDSLCYYDRYCKNEDYCQNNYENCINNKCTPASDGYVVVNTEDCKRVAYGYDLNQGLPDVSEDLSMSHRQQIIGSIPEGVEEAHLWLVDVCSTRNKLLKAGCGSQGLSILEENWAEVDGLISYIEIDCARGEICSKGACITNPNLPKPILAKTSKQSLSSRVRTSITNLFRR